MCCHRMRARSTMMIAIGRGSTAEASVHGSRYESGWALAGKAERELLKSSSPVPLRCFCLEAPSDSPSSSVSELRRLPRFGLKEGSRARTARSSSTCTPSLPPSGYGSLGTHPALEPYTILLNFLHTLPLGDIWGFYTEFQGKLTPGLNILRLKAFDQFEKPPGFEILTVTFRRSCEVNDYEWAALFYHLASPLALLRHFLGRLEARRVSSDPARIMGMGIVSEKRMIEACWRKGSYAAQRRRWHRNVDTFLMEMSRTPFSSMVLVYVLWQGKRVKVKFQRLTAPSISRPRGGCRKIATQLASGGAGGRVTMCTSALPRHSERHHTHPEQPRCR
ncbi:hypothetical protein KC367_g266 [Hortaea werneckii]|nr:hypothetical protein KC367_g266 [Hortaea werneckii]